MTEREIESGFELVVDNRKRIIAFAIVILVCGCFFVWGFMAGKRQGMQLSAIADTDVSPGSGIEGPQQPTADTNVSVTETPLPEEDAVQQDLDWYHSVNKKGSDPVGIQPPKAADQTKETARSGAVSGPVSYSVQVGAFNRRPEAEAHARNVRSKGFDSRVEPPESSGKLYLVKVGKFDTRAEAVAVQLRLKKNGFSCFVKTN